MPDGERLREVMITELITPQLNDLQTMIDRAADEYDWKTLRELVTQALELPDLPPADEYKLRASRAKANQFLADMVSEADDLKIMVALAEGLGDEILRAAALNLLAIAYVELADRADKRLEHELFALTWLAATHLADDDRTPALEISERTVNLATENEFK